MVARFHYDEAVYRRLLDDELPSEQLGEITAHIEACEACQTKLEAVSEEGVDWNDVRGYLRSEGQTAVSSARSTVRDAEQLATATSSSTNRTVHKAEFLSPSDREGSLGRFGRYEVEDILGRGGMGVVLRGYDPALNRHSAIKVLAPELATSAAARSRFAREAKSAAAVVHEHVVPIQTVDEEHGLPYLVMPVIEGKSLEQRVEQQGPLSVKEILRIGMQAASGLAAAHAQGLVHRDVKPANILLENGVERVMITDFGLARAADDANMTQSGVIAGTPQYMSPEQARGSDVDQRSDLFSLGSVLYYMCTGRSPFRAETTMGVLNRIANDTPREIRAINPDVPVWLQDIISRLLEKDPSRRFPSADELADLLGRWLAHVQQPDVVPPPEKVRNSAQAGRGRSAIVRWILCAAAAAAIVLAGVVIVLETNKGTIKIECARNDVPVRITSGGEVVRELTLERGENSVRIAAGEYRVEIEGKHDELIVDNGTVTLKRGGDWIAKIVERPADGKEDVDQPVVQIVGKLLADVVREFNRDIPDSEADIAPLTEDEVIAWARWSMRDASSNTIAPVLRAIAEQRIVPVGWRIQGRVRVDDRRIEVWTVELLSADDKSNHVIRRRLIQRLAEDDKPLELPAPTETKEDGVPLAAAIYAFNEQWGKTKLGKDQPPLTEQEVLAAIEDWKTRRIEAPVTNSEFASLQQITDTRLLPTDTSFELLTSFRPGDGYTYDRWSIRILTPRTAKPGWTYAYEIRDRFLGVRKADESDDEGIYDEYRILPGSGLPRGPYQRRPLGASKEGGSTASPEERKSEEEIEKVVGTWVLAGTEDDEEPETIEVERNGYSITLKFTDVAGDRKNALVNLSPSDDPPRFDLADLSLSGAPTWVGNYKVEGDTLSLEFTGVSGLRGRPLNWPQIQKLDDSPRTFKGEYRRQAKSKMDE